MASIHKEIPIDASAEEVWDAVRDFGAVHTRLAPGFVIDARLDGDARIVTFANGMVARELLVDCDDDRRRLVYAIPPNERIVHYSAAIEVAGDGRRELPGVLDRRCAAGCDGADDRGQMDLGVAGDAEDAEPRRRLIWGRRRHAAGTAFGPHRVSTTLSADSTPSSTIEAAASRRTRRRRRGSTSATSRRRRRTTAARSAPAPGPSTLAAPCDEKYIEIDSPMKAYIGAAVAQILPAGGAHAGIVGEQIDPEFGKDRDHACRPRRPTANDTSAGDPGDPPRPRHLAGADRHADHRHRGDADRERDRGQHEFEPRADAVAGQHLGAELRQHVGEDA